MVQDGVTENAVCLTEAEALGLLDMIMLTPTDLTPEQRAAMLKLSDFCREFLRDNSEPNSATLANRPRSDARSQYAA